MRNSLLCCLSFGFGVLGAVYSGWAGEPVISADEGRVSVSVQTEAEQFYGLEASSDLQTWSTQTTFAGDGSRRSFDVDVNGKSMLFFRFVTEVNERVELPANLALNANAGFSTGASATATVLQQNGVATANDLFNRFGSIYKLNSEVERLRTAGVKIDAGAVVNLLRETELRSNLQALKTAGTLRTEAINALAQSGQSMERLYGLLKPLTGGTTLASAQSKAGQKSDALDHRSAETFMELNNNLREIGSLTLTRAEFVVLRDHVGTLSPLSSSATSSGNQGMVQGRSNQQEQDLPAQKELGLIGKSPDNYNYVPRAIQVLNRARLIEEPLPLALIGYRYEKVGNNRVPVAVEATPPFTTDGEDATRRSFLINKTGMAWFTVYANAKGGHLHIKNAAGTVLIDEQLPAQASRTFVLPVFSEDTCAQFSILRDAGLSVTLVGMMSPVMLDESITDTGLEARAVELPAITNSPIHGCGWYQFPCVREENDTQNIVLSITAQNETLSAESGTYTALLVSPDGTQMSTPLQVAIPTALEFTKKNGRWNLFIYPTSALSFTGGTGKLATVGLLNRILERPEVLTTLDLTASFSSVKTREFLVGILDRTAFARDGEADGNRAEVKLTLTTNVAPFFENSSHFSAIFAGDAQYEAWKLWWDNGKNTSGLMTNATFTNGLAAIKTNAKVVPFMIGWASFTDQDYLQAFTAYMRDELGKNWYTHLDSASQIYDEWSNSVVQIVGMKYPMGNRYNVCDSFQTSLIQYTERHPVIPVGMPFYAVPKDRMANETMPVSFSYSAVEMDELDKWDIIGSAVKGVVNIGLAISSGNFAEAACSGVGMIDEMNSTMEAAKDDPIGSANLRLNRVSSQHGFYGLDSGGRNGAQLSGAARDNRDHTLENVLSYAKLACRAKDVFSGSANIGAIKGIVTALNGDLTDIDNLQNLLISMAGEDPEKIKVIKEVVAKIKVGSYDPNDADTNTALDLAAASAALTNGDDVYGDLTALLSAIQDLRGTGALGHNLLRSNCYFHFNGWNSRKTNGETTLATVRSVPIKKTVVAFDKVRVFDLQEDINPLDDAEVYLNTRVGVVADQAPTAWTGVELQYVEDGRVVADNGGRGYATVGLTPFTAFAKKKWDTRYYVWSAAGPDDTWYPRGGDTLDTTMLNATWGTVTQTNAAAIYVEIGVFENDGDTADDDMIGVFSQTFLLEDLMNGTDARWSRIDATHWRLTVTDATVFSACWLETVVEINTGNSAEQAEHNLTRLEHPSAMISFHVDLELGQFTPWVDNNVYDIKVGEPATDLETALNPKVISQGSQVNVDQLLAVNGSKALTHLCRESNDDLHQLALWSVTPTNTPALSIVATLPLQTWAADAQVPFGPKYLNAALARDGRIIVVLHEQGLVSYDLANPAQIVTQSYSLAGLYPSRLAVDADGHHVYVSLRDTDKDLRVFELSATGALTLVQSLDDFPRTIAGLVSLPAGGVVVHYVGELKQNSHGYGVDYWDSAEDVDGYSFQDQRFGNSNGFANLQWKDGKLALLSYYDIARDVNEGQMRFVDERHSSSMFRLYDDRTIISRGSNYPFSLRLDQLGFFTDAKGTNQVDAQFHKYLVSYLRGANVKGRLVSATIPTTINKDFDNLYLDDESAQSPFCVYNQNQFVASPSQFTISQDFLSLGDAAGRYILATAIPDSSKINPMAMVWDKASINWQALQRNLVLIDLLAEESLVFSPQLLASMQTGHIIHAVFTNNNSYLVTCAYGNTDGVPLYIRSIADPASPGLPIAFGRDKYVSYLAYSEENHLLFAAADNPNRVDVYDLSNPQSPLFVTELALYARPLSMQWSKKQQSLYIGGEDYNNVFIYHRSSTGTWTFAFSPPVTDEYDANVSRMSLSDDASRLVALYYPNGATSPCRIAVFSLADAQMTLLGRFIPDSTWDDLSLESIVITPDGQTAYVDGVIYASVPYRIVRLDLRNPAAPVLNGGFTAAQLGSGPYYSFGLMMSPRGDYLMSSGYGIRAIDLHSDLANPTVTLINNSSMVGISSDGKLLLTMKTTGNNITLLELTTLYVTQ
ncbi:MAG: WD40 repeat domain-containing protein [Verrucomicrobiota bacterium]|nr:WD40 repeat domain-containing protein [Verrucomicrobiota bacterium]